MRSENSQSDIEFVYFDLGNVLLSFDPSLACANLAQRFSIDVGRARASVYESGLQDRFERGTVTAEQFAGEIRQRLGKSESEMPTTAVLDALSDMFTPIESMRTFLHTVRRRRLGVGLLSNTCDAHWNWIHRQKYSVMDFQFDLEILSFEVGAMKPDDAIYDAAEAAASLPPHRILFLDDRIENVSAAKNRGWHAVQCLGGEAAVRALQALGMMDESL